MSEHDYTADDGLTDEERAHRQTSIRLGTRIEALEAALREIVHEYTELGRMQDIARKALGEES